MSYLNRSKSVTGSILLEDTYCRIVAGYEAEPDVNNNPVFFFTRLELTIAGISLKLMGWQKVLIIKEVRPDLLKEAQKDLDQQIAHAEECYQLRNAGL